MGLMMGSQKDGRRVDLLDLSAVPVPHATETYCPVAHEALVTLTDETVQRVARYGEPVRREYGLAQNGKQMFFCLTYNDGGDGHNFCVAGRNSYNMTMAAGVAGGRNVMCCDNKQLWGDLLNLLRKHTPNVWADLPVMIEQAIRQATTSGDAMTAHFAAMQQVEVSLTRGYEMLGVALGTKVIRSQQATIAYKAWDEDWHDAGRSYYGVLQALTEGTKQGSAGRSLTSHMGVYGYVLDATREFVAHHPDALDAQVVDLFESNLSPAIEVAAG